MGLFDWFGKFKVERNRDGGFSYWETETAFGVNKDLLNISLENFVVMSVISMRAKIYSQMKITHVNKNGEEIKDSPFIKLLKQIRSFTPIGFIEEINQGKLDNCIYKIFYA